MLKFRNPYVNKLKKNITELKKKHKELDDELHKFTDSKCINEQLNNMILVEVSKAVKKLAKKYNLDEKEALDFILKSKVTETTPRSLRRGCTDDDIEEETDTTREIYIQKTAPNGKKVYVKDNIVYDELLNQIGSYDSTKDEILITS